MEQIKKFRTIGENICAAGRLVHADERQTGLGPAASDLEGRRSTN